MPYDNAPLERIYFNSFINEFYFLFKFEDYKAINQGIMVYAAMVVLHLLKLEELLNLLHQSVTKMIDHYR